MLHIETAILDNIVSFNTQDTSESKGSVLESSTTITTSVPHYLNKLNQEETKSDTKSDTNSILDLTESTANSINFLNSKFKDTFNNLLPKLANKSSEKSRNYFSLVSDIDNTVVSPFNEFRF